MRARTIRYALTVVALATAGACTRAPPSGPQRHIEILSIGGGWGQSARGVVIHPNGDVVQFTPGSRCSGTASGDKLLVQDDCIDLRWSVSPVLRGRLSANQIEHAMRVAEASEEAPCLKVGPQPPDGGSLHVVTLVRERARDAWRVHRIKGADISCGPADKLLEYADLY